MENAAQKQIEEDFKRDVRCILGLPFDNYSIEQTCEAIDRCIKDGRQCVLSTPNLDWITGSLRDKEFKEAILSSDMNVIDGSPILWTARVLRTGITVKVPGSSLVEYMIKENRAKSYRIFFFGGRKGVAEKAVTALGDIKTSMKAAGWLYPGFGSIESMSTDDIIRAINDAEPNIVSVALGAKRGMLWINKNRDRLSAQILVPFGAVVNFVAGSVKRAPVWMQRCGLEWLWRIKEEPVLWARYFRDGVVFIRLIITRIIPYSIFLMLNKRHASIGEDPRIKTCEESQVIRIKISGACNHSNRATVRECFKAAAGLNKDILIDLSGAEYVDSSFLGYLLILYKHQKARDRKLTVTGAGRTIKNVFWFNMVDDIIPLCKNREGEERCLKSIES